MDGFGGVKISSRGGDVPRIHALVKVTGCTERDHSLMIFSAAEVARLYQDGDGTTSALQLADGMLLPTSLSVEELERRIYNHSFKDGDVIDLTDVTGPAAKETIEQRIAERFNFLSKNSSDDALVMKVILRREIRESDPWGVLQTKMGDWEVGELSDRDVYSFSYGGGKQTLAKTRSRSNIDIAVPLERLKARYEAARQKGYAFVDLTDEATMSVVSVQNPPRPEFR